MRKNNGGISLWILVLILLVVAAAAVYWFKIPLPWQAGSVEMIPVSSSQPNSGISSAVKGTGAVQLQSAIEEKEQELTRVQQEYKQAMEDMEILKQLISDTDQSIKEREAEVQRLKQSKPGVP